MYKTSGRRVTIAVIGVIAALGMAGCSAEPTASGSAAGADGGLPAEIKLVGVRNQTGPVAYSGIDAAKGAALAAKEINEQGYLGEGVKIVITEKDSAFDPQLAASEVTAAAADASVVALLGPSISSEALAVAPIAQAAGIPIVFTQSGVDGLLDGGDKLFRASAPIHTYIDLVTDSIVEEGAQTVSVLNSATNPAYNEVGGKVIPELLEKEGVEVVSSFDLESSVSDFQAPVSRIVNEDPDAVVITLIGPQITTAVKQLRQAGFEGSIYTTAAVVDKQLVPAGDDAVGVRYATTFSASQTTEEVTAFVTAFEAENGVMPNLFAAESYDQVWWIARAIKESGSASREAIAEGLAAVAEDGFMGVQGELTFEEGHDLRSPGVLVAWNGSGEDLVE
jgi:branched-chain amino acid transport system substrate-binding protein